MEKCSVILFLIMLNMQIFALEQEQYNKIIDTIKFELSKEFFTKYTENHPGSTGANNIYDSLYYKDFYPDVESLIKNNNFDSVNIIFNIPIDSLKQYQIEQNLNIKVFNFLFDSLIKRKEIISLYDSTLKDVDLQNKIKGLLKRNFISIKTPINNNDAYTPLNTGIDSLNSEIKKINDKLSIGIVLVILIVVLVLIIVFILIPNMNPIKIIFLRFKNRNKKEDSKKDKISANDKIELAENIICNLRFGKDPVKSNFESIEEKIRELLNNNTNYSSLIHYINKKYNKNLLINASVNDIIETLEQNKNKYMETGKQDDQSESEKLKTSDSLVVNESNIFYFGTPNEKGTFQDKYKKIKPNEESLFKFIKKGNEYSKIARFEVYTGNEKMILRAIENTANYLDPVCISEYKSIPGNKGIKTLEPGTAILNSQGIWEVTKENRAVIEFY